MNFKGTETLSSLHALQRHCYKNEKTSHGLEDKILQIVYLIKSLYPEYIKNAQNLVIRKQIIQLKIDKLFEQTAHHGSYGDAKESQQNRRNIIRH